MSAAQRKAHRASGIKHGGGSARLQLVCAAVVRQHVGQALQRGVRERHALRLRFVRQRPALRLVRQSRKQARQTAACAARARRLCVAHARAHAGCEERQRGQRERRRDSQEKRWTQQQRKRRGVAPQQPASRQGVLARAPGAARQALDQRRCDGVLVVGVLCEVSLQLARLSRVPCRGH